MLLQAHALVTDALARATGCGASGILLSRGCASTSASRGDAGEPRCVRGRGCSACRIRTLQRMQYMYHMRRGGGVRPAGGVWLLFLLK